MDLAWGSTRRSQPAATEDGGTGRFRRGWIERGRALPARDEESGRLGAGGRLRAGAAAARARAGCAWAYRAAGGGRKAAGRVALSRWLGGDWSGGAGEWDGAKWRTGGGRARKTRRRQLGGLWRTLGVGLARKWTWGCPFIGRRG